MTGPAPRRGRSASALLAAAALLPLLLSASCAPALKALPSGEAEAAARFFREKWGSFSYPSRASFLGTAESGGGAWPVVVGVESLSPGSETVAVFDPFGHEVVAARNDGAALTFRAGGAAGALAFLDDRSVPVAGFSAGRLFAGLPAFEPVPEECLRGDGGGWVLRGKEQTLRSDGDRRVLREARYRLLGKELAVSYPGWDGTGAPPVVSIEGPGGAVTVRRDAE